MESQKNIRCNVCGGNDITFQPHSRIGRCNSCGALLTLPDFEDHEILSLLNQAYLQRTTYKFDEAIATYTYIIEKNPNEISAYEGLLLSKYGIVYEYDEDKKINVPTCRRYNPKNVLEDESYISYLSYCKSEEEKDVFRQQANQISYLQREITKQLTSENDYDVFISFKAKDENGKTSRDAEIARELYDILTNKGLRVFMSEVTLKNRISQEFEPIIFRALHSSEYFILIGTSKENVESNWVRNEWSRFIDRVKDPTDEVTIHSFICVYDDGMDPNLFPRINHKQIQCVDASDLSYKYNICDYICREEETKVKEKPVYAKKGSKQLLCVEEISFSRRKAKYVNNNDPISSVRKGKALAFIVPFLFIGFIIAGLLIARNLFLDSSLSDVRIILLVLAISFGALDALLFTFFILTLMSDDYYLNISKEDVIHVSFGIFANKISFGNNLFYSGKDRTIEFKYQNKSYVIEIEDKKVSLSTIVE